MGFDMGNHVCGQCRYWNPNTKFCWHPSIKFRVEAENWLTQVRANYDSCFRFNSIDEKKEADMKNGQRSFDWLTVAEDVHSNSVEHGFWPNGQRNFGEAIALVMSELGEAMEAHRKKAMAEHIDGFCGVEEELADAVIRIMDLAVGLGIDLGGALLAKHEYNKSRPHKHGKEY